jgi:hypothetical protein
MEARSAIRSGLKQTAPQASYNFAQELAQHLLLFALFFTVLMLLHAPLLRLPYFWDEAGYYVPAARDLFLSGTLIPHSTPSNAHPPLVMAWLALAWRVFGYSTQVTRTAMLAVSAFSLVGLFRLSRIAANLQVAWATTILVALYPVYFTQSSMAQVDLPAAGFTFWGLAAYINSFKKEGRQWQHAVWFSLAALAKETAILAPLALLAWEMVARLIPPRLINGRWKEFLPPLSVPPLKERGSEFYLLIPLLPLAAWYAYHYSKTGFLFGNPEFFRYNVAATLNPLRIPLALLMRLWQLFGYLGLYLLTLAGLLAMFRPPQRHGTISAGESRERIPFWMQGAFLAVLLAYLAFMSIVGGAVLARYMLPVVPLVVLALVSTLWRRVRYWKLIAAGIALAFSANLFTNPPYGFSLEDNLAYRDYVVMHAEAARFLALRYPGKRVLTAWPASDELSRPWLGYITRPFPVLRIEDFSAPQISLAAVVSERFDVALVFSTKYEPPHPLFQNWEAWQRLKEKFFGYHRDLRPEDIARQIGGAIVFHAVRDGQWAAVIALQKAENAKEFDGSPAQPILDPHQVAGMRLDHEPDIPLSGKLQ